MTEATPTHAPVVIQEVQPDAAPKAPPETRMLLACDLDSVLLVGDPEDRLHLYQLLSQQPGILLVYMTRRAAESVMPLLDDPTLPLPAYLICDAGATVVDAEGRFIGALQDETEAGWPGVQRVQQALADMPGLQFQNVPQRGRCAYTCDPEALTPALLDAIQRLGCDHQYTDEAYLDVLPRGVRKSTSLRRLVEHLALDPADVLVATDSLTRLDQQALLPGFRVVHVDRSGRAFAERPPGDSRVLRARRVGCGAVLEAMAHFGFLGEMAMRALAHRPAPEGLARLVLVYHRLPYEESVQGGKVLRRRPQSPNGIIPTLLSFFGRGVEGSWVAWSIYEPDQGPFEVHTPVDARRFPKLTAARVPLSKRQVDIFYKRFSKEAFWPVLHTFWERARYSEDDWQVFLEVNRAFAQASALEAAHGATVWLHDYNLWMVPAYLRELRPDLRIAFFHHTHFPSPDCFNVLPWRRQIIASLLQCDLIGFHIPRQVENFVEVVRGMAPVEVVERTGCAPRFVTYGCAVGVDQMSTRIRVHGREVRLGAFPVGLDAARIEEALASKRYQALRADVRDSLGGCKLILSVERLDYTKGILQKLEAFEALLAEHPELHGKVMLTTICVPAASEMSIYDELKAQIEQVAGRINGRFARVDWTPLQFYFRGFSFEEVCAFYANADVMWITPLCDGLNLVAFEYAATQVATEGLGVLVLSEFTGAAAILKDALLTNPHDPRDLQDRLLQALAMEPQEIRWRLRGLHETLQQHTLERWGQDFLGALHDDGPARPG